MLLRSPRPRSVALVVTLLAAACGESDPTVRETSWGGCTRGSDCASGECNEGVCRAVPDAGGSGGASGAPGAGGAPTLPGDPAWACVGQPDPNATNDALNPATLRLTDHATGSPVTGLQARLCGRVDVDCASPIGGVRVSDDSGTVLFDLPSGFTGYALVTGDAFLPALIFFARDVKAPSTQTVALLTSADADALFAATGVTRDPERGSILVSVQDCSASPAAGVSILADTSGARIFYSEGGSPSLAATATDASGEGGVLNPAAGFLSLTGTVGSPPATVSSARIFTKAGAVSYVRLLPDTR